MSDQSPNHPMPTFNVLYLADQYQLAVMHAQVDAIDRKGAIKAARKELGKIVYILSVAIHETDMNPNE